MPDVQFFFYHQALFGTAEVSNEGADRMLTPERGAARLSVAQPCPEPPFGFGRIMTQPTGTITKGWGLRLHDAFPSPRPSPRRGKGIFRLCSLHEVLKNPTSLERSMRLAFRFNDHLFCIANAVKLIHLGVDLAVGLFDLALELLLFNADGLGERLMETEIASMYPQRLQVR